MQLATLEFKWQCSLACRPNGLQRLSAGYSINASHPPNCTLLGALRTPIVGNCSHDHNLWSCMGLANAFVFQAGSMPFYNAAWVHSGGLQVTGPFFDPLYGKQTTQHADRSVPHSCSPLCCLVMLHRRKVISWARSYTMNEAAPQSLPLRCALSCTMSTYC